jgi:hypothetical protein
MAREAVISTSALNAYGTRILTEGLDIEQYKKNPIVLYMHRRGSREDIPIGIMENIRVEGDKIFGTPKIDKDTEEEKVIAAKWERGTLRMLSAGIDIIECSDDPQYLVQGQTRPTIIRSRLFEVSIVDVGANDDALQVRLYNDGKQLTLAKDEDNDLLPLLKPDDKPKNTTFQMNEILMTLGLPTTATEADAVSAIQALKAQNDTLTLARITDTVTAARERGLITEAQEPKMLELGKKAGIETRDTLSMMTPARRPSDFIDEKGSGNGHQTLAWDKLSDEEKMTLRRENPTQYVQAFKAHYGVAPDFMND